MNEKIIAFRKKWESGEIPSTLKDKTVPSDKDKTSKEELYENVKLRFKDLAKVLNLLYSIYKTNKDLYGEKFLAFVGHYVVREWPNKDLVFTSEKGKLAFSKNEKLLKEHWTPISFFRDLFKFKDYFPEEEDLTEKDFEDALLYYYRVVNISKDDENARLDKYKFKAIRPYNSYKILEGGPIEIEQAERELWEKLYSAYDKFHE